MRILDRYIIKSFLVNCLLALVVLLGLYVLLDLIVNFDRFAKGAADASSLSLILDIVDYYGYQMLAIFYHVAGIVPLVGAGFTMVRMTRHNEHTAMLSSGVSLYRVAAPIVVISMLIGLLAIVDQELIMPRCQDKLLRRHEEVNRVSTEKLPALYFIEDQTNLLLAGGYDKEKKAMRDVVIIWRDAEGRALRYMTASVARWEPSPHEEFLYPGRWRLEGDVKNMDTPQSNGSEPFVGRVQPLNYDTTLVPDHIELMLSKRAVDFMPYSKIEKLKEYSPRAAKANLERIMHIRVTQPLMNLIMLLLGIPFLLTRLPGLLIKNIVYCIIVCGICFAGTFICYQLAGTVISPLLGAWLPVLVFGPVALVALDSIRT